MSQKTETVSSYLKALVLLRLLSDAVDNKLEMEKIMDVADPHLIEIIKAANIFLDSAHVERYIKIALPSYFKE